MDAPLHPGSVARDPGVDPVAADAVDDFFALLRRMSSYYADTCAACDLTPQQANVLRGLTAPSPMRELARSLGYDASNLTGIVDRLEERGLVERSPHPSDRRVRHLALTAAGTELRGTLEARLMSDPPLLRGLGPDQRLALRHLLRQALDADCAETAAPA